MSTLYGRLEFLLSAPRAAIGEGIQVILSMMNNRLELLWASIAVISDGFQAIIPRRESSLFLWNKIDSLLNFQQNLQVDPQDSMQQRAAHTLWEITSVTQTRICSKILGSQSAKTTKIVPTAGAATLYSAPLDPAHDAIVEGNEMPECVEVNPNAEYDEEDSVHTAHEPSEAGEGFGEFDTPQKDMPDKDKQD